MIIVDTSAWVEFLRATGSSVHHHVRQLIADGAPIATTDIVYMELLAGARNEVRARELRRFLLRFDHLGIAELEDYERAADLYRTCRRNGETPRQLTDCLVAAAAIRHDAPVLHNDRDFDVISRWTDLCVHPAEG